MSLDSAGLPDESIEAEGALVSACPECQHEKNRHGDDGCLVYINDEDDTYCPCTRRFAPEPWGKPTPTYTTHVLNVLVRINNDVAQGDELDLVRDHIQEGVDAVDLEAVKVALL